jgi:hypothetical protein
MTNWWHDDVIDDSSSQSVGTRIVIDFARSDPPEGRVGDGVVTGPFYGWLGLIRALADAVARAPHLP